jgi:drug/metabolite transporter (DMT)-like permease
MKLKDWGKFILLGVVWGSSFLWIKIALNEIGPVMVVALRMLFGVLTLLPVILIVRPAFPTRARDWVVLAVLGVTNTALPFVLISWAEKSIDSSVASVLNATVPLFTLIFAHLFLDDDRMNPARVLGLVSGFAGVVLLMSRDLNIGGVTSGLIGQAAMLLAAAAYGASAVFARRTTKKIAWLVQSAVPLVFGDALLWALLPTLEGSFKLPTLGITWIAVLWLGVLGAGVAYLLYFSLLHSVGPTRTMMVTYLFPLLGLVLGAIFLDEILDLRLVGGAILIVGGIVIVNWVRHPEKQLEPKSV